MAARPQSLKDLYCNSKKSTRYLVYDCKLGLLKCQYAYYKEATVEPTKSDSDEKLCLQLFSKTLTCTLQLSQRESIDHLSINPILWIGLIHK